MPARPLTFIQGRNLSIVGQRYFYPRRLEAFEIGILSISFAERNYFDKMIGYELELKFLAVAMAGKKKFILVFIYYFGFGLFFYSCAVPNSVVDIPPGRFEILCLLMV